MKKFEDWCDNQAILRFIISETNVNTTCFIESINFSERDGTGDIYAKLKIAQYRVLKNISTQISKDTGNKQRNEDIKKEKTKSYSVVKGDTLSAICRKFYGDANLYNKLAKYNNIKNPHLIFVGQVITIPDKANYEVLAMNIYIINNNKTYDITQYVGTATLSGDYQLCARQLDFTLVSNAADSNIQAINCSLGDGVVLKENEKIIFNGFIFERDKSKNDSLINITCFDRGIYLKRNKGILYKCFIHCRGYNKTYM